MEIAELIDKRNKLATDMRAMVADAEAEDRGFSAEEREQWDKMNGDYESLDSRIETVQRANAVDPDAFFQVGREDTAGDDGTDDPTEDRTAAFTALLRSAEPGHSGLSPEHRAALQGMKAEARALATGTDSAGGYLVPEEMANQIEMGMLDYGGIESVSTVLTTSSGNPLPHPTSDDTGNVGALLAENVQDSEQDTTFGEVVLNAYKFTSKIIRVSVELLQDSAFDINSYLAAILSERLGRVKATYLATGTGSSQPAGLMVAAGTGKTAASATAIAYSEMLDLKHSVDPAYRKQGAQWAFNDTTLKALKQLVDGDSRPLWQPAIAEVVPATIDGDRYIIDQGIDSIATGNDTVAYGNMKKFMVRNVRGVQLVRLVERYADYHQVGFIGFIRADSNLIDASAGAVKVLTQA